MTSKRQQRKAARSNRRDKWGNSMSLSRPQRRAKQRHDNTNHKVIDNRVNTHLQAGQIATDPVSGHVHHYAGSNRAH